MEGPIEDNKKESSILLESNSWTLPTDIESIDLAEDAFGEKLKAAGWTFDEAFELKLGFREALVNAIAHGNLGLIKPENGNLGEMIIEELKKNPAKKEKKIHVDVDVNKDRVYVRIQDEGKGFNHNDAPDPTLPNTLKKTKGRGLFLMEKFFDSVEYIGKGNEVIMSKERKNK